MRPSRSAGLVLVLAAFGAAVLARLPADAVQPPANHCRRFAIRRSIRRAGARPAGAPSLLDEKVGFMVHETPGIARLGIRHNSERVPPRRGPRRPGDGVPAYYWPGRHFDDDLIGRIGAAIAAEARAKHAAGPAAGATGLYTGLTFWTPTVNIFRDAGWGRAGNYAVKIRTYGTLGAALVRGPGKRPATAGRAAAPATSRRSGLEASRQLLLNTKPRSRRPTCANLPPAFAALADAGGRGGQRAP